MVSLVTKAAKWQYNGLYCWRTQRHFPEWPPISKSIIKITRYHPLHVAASAGKNMHYLQVFSVLAVLQGPQRGVTTWSIYSWTGSHKHFNPFLDWSTIKNGIVSTEILFATVAGYGHKVQPSARTVFTTSAHCAPEQNILCPEIHT